MMKLNSISLLKTFEKAEREYQEAIGEIQSRSSELFKAIREERNWTQQQLADFLGCSGSYISKIERGHYVAGKPLLRKLSGLL